jgi:hypothetical protein
MYNIVNILVHVLGIVLLIYACVPDHGYRSTDLTLQKAAGMFALGLMGFWALGVGEFENLKSLIALVW